MRQLNRDRAPTDPSGRGRFPAPIRLGLAVVGAFAVVSCDGGGDEIPIDDLPAALESAICRMYAECDLAPDEATCRASVSYAESTQALTIVAAVKRGTAQYDGKLAAECLAQFGHGCSVGSMSSAACDATFRGTVAEGGACVADVECVSQRCDQSCTDACCVGTCQPARVAVGSDCTGLDTSCVEGAYCNGATCVASVAVGGACTSDAECVTASFCSATAAGAAGTCVTLPAEGQSCDPEDIGACLRIDNYCDAATRTCVKRKAPGQTCSSTTSLGLPECVLYATCEGGVCTALPTAGQSCETAPRCLGDLDCASNVCTRPPAGSTCTP